MNASKRQLINSFLGQNVLMDIVEPLLLYLV